MNIVLVTLSLFGASLLKGTEPEIVRDRTFVGGALYGFINGGSDLYLEYGFKELRAVDVSYKGGNYSVELYEMGSPEDAFGIYSLHTFNFFKSDTLFFADCYSKYQMQCVKGRFYLSVVYDTPCDTADMNAVELARYFIPENDFSEAVIPELIAAETGRLSGNLKMVKGDISVMNVPRQLAAFVEGVNNYNLWVADTTNKGDRVALFTTDNGDFLKTVTSRLPASAIINHTSNSVFFKF